MSTPVIIALIVAAIVIVAIAAILYATSDTFANAVDGVVDTFIGDE